MRSFDESSPLMRMLPLYTAQWVHWLDLLMQIRMEPNIHPGQKLLRSKTRNFKGDRAITTNTSNLVCQKKCQFVFRGYICTQWRIRTKLKTGTLSKLEKYYSCQGLQKRYCSPLPTPNCTTERSWETAVLLKIEGMDLEFSFALENVKQM